MNRFRNMSIWKKVNILVITCGVLLFAVYLLVWGNVNHMVQEIDRVYGSNVSLNGLQSEIDAVQTSMEEYLNTRNSIAMEAYYTAVEQLENTRQSLNDKPINSESKMMEKNIRGLIDSYLTAADVTVEARRARNVEKYREGYEEVSNIYSHIRICIYTLNNAQFQNNATQYNVLLKTLHYSEVTNVVIIVMLILFELFLLSYMVRRITSPLVELSKAANEVADGNFDVQMVSSGAMDEVGIVIRAFNKMLESIRRYIVELKESNELQVRLREKEHEMETSLKDAKLKYLQAQIHPHFLFNCLNAGAQLSMLENAPKTYEYTQNMAEFFRYNLKNMDEVTLQDELDLIDHYIYILNVRFAGEIHYEKIVDETVTDLRMPGMILEPIVENAVNYGISGIDREKKITLEVSRLDDMVSVSIRDNGVGIEQEHIDSIMRGEGSKSDSKSSNGVGLVNVINRLKLYYNIEEIMFINSLGHNVGTEVMLCLPYNGDGQSREVESC